VAEIIMAGLAMFIFKRKSRNHADKSINCHFETNFITLFGLRLPIMETVDKFLRQLPPDEMEKLKRVLIQGLLERKVLDKWKFMGRHNISIDGTGISSFDHEPFEDCPFKKSKKGKKTWYAYVVEAKLICGNGFCLSIASEWLQNSEDITEKQDCEQKAFVRLAKKVKAMYPRLPIMVTADSLYPNKTCFDICRQYGWDFIFVLQEGSLKSIWEEVRLLYPLEESANMQEHVIRKNKSGWLTEKSMFINDLEYKGYSLSWSQCQFYYSGNQAHQQFVHITNIRINKKNARDISRHGRMRWTIENQGFNTQKNGGYALEHKYARKHLGAMKNYYELLQIAHMINQLVEKLIKVKQAVVQANSTIIAIAEDIVGTMRKEIIEVSEIILLLNQTRQLRY